MRSLTPNMGNLVQREHPKIGVEYEWGQRHMKAVRSPKRCKIGPRLYGLIGSRICAFDWHQYQWPWMTLNGRNVPLAEIKSSYGAHQKNLNEDRPISLVAKCRPMILLARNIKCMRISGYAWRGASCRILATYTYGQIVLLDRIKLSGNVWRHVVYIHCCVVILILCSFQGSNVSKCVMFCIRIA